MTDVEAMKAREVKIAHARMWVEKQLREDGGPHPKGSAVIVVRARPIPGDASGGAYLDVIALPDLDITALADVLQDFIDKLKAGALQMTSHGLPDEEVKQ